MPTRGTADFLPRRTVERGSERAVFWESRIWTHEGGGGITPLFPYKRAPRSPTPRCLLARKQTHPDSVFLKHRCCSRGPSKTLGPAGLPPLAEQVACFVKILPVRAKLLADEFPCIRALQVKPSDLIGQGYNDVNDVIGL